MTQRRIASEKEVRAVEERMECEERLHETETYLDELRHIYEDQKHEIVVLTEALRDACDVAQWMSGSRSFSPEGEAHDGWVNVMRPKLFVAMAVLDGRSARRAA